MKNKSVTMIPATKRVGTLKVDAEEKPKLRVAAYCRVSTDSDEQASSYEVQVEHYANFINSNSEWELAGIYADDGISGTSTKNREEFNRLIQDCMENKVDRIITKSISRFARNTLDCLKYIRQLKEKNIPVFFEKENIDTMDSKGEIMLTIMASLAQQESQSLSQNVKLGLQYRYQQGEITINHNRFLGYTKDEDGHLIIEPTEAEVVKRIFKEYLEGSSLIQIARNLEADRILTGAGNKNWAGTTVKGILVNEKYMGDALLAKTHTVDLLTKKRVKNNGIVPQYYVENSHEPIIPKTLFLQVQEEITRRANLKNKKGSITYSSKYALSGITYCGKCGEIYRRLHWNNRGKKSIVWRCYSRLDKTKDCDARTILEEDLKQVVVDGINRVFGDEGRIKDILNSNIQKMLKVDNTLEVETIDSQLQVLQQQLLEQSSKNQDVVSIGNQIIQLKEKKQSILLSKAESNSSKQRMAEMMEFIEQDGKDRLEYDEVFVRRLVEQVMVYDENITIKFKSGIEIEVQN
ncbi:TPA_asm: recombinase family protein [Listeria monocytogenes]|nr:recombinase family protein [Listeria monocytogenes]